MAFEPHVLQGPIPAGGGQESAQGGGERLDILVEKRESLLKKYLEAEEEFCEATDHKAVQERTSCPSNLVWREMVCKWGYEVVDMLGEARSVVYVAMNILDRFCAVTQSESPLNERTYEHASMTALFLAVRTTGNSELQMTDLIRMSRNSVQLEDIISTGKQMLGLLTWGPRLITPIDFVHAMLHCLPSSVGGRIKDELLESACFLVEIAVCDIYLARFAASQVAFSAILNAAQSSGVLTSSELQSFRHKVELTSYLRHSSRQTRSVRTRLESVYSRIENRQQESSPNYVSDDDEEEEDNSEDHLIPSRNSCRSFAEESDDESGQSHIETKTTAAHQLSSHSSQNEHPTKRARRFSLS